MDRATWPIVIGVAVLILLFAPRYGLVPLIARWAAFRRRVLFEHALKHLVEPEHHGGGRPLSLAEALEISPRRALGVAEAMRRAGLLRIDDRDRAHLSQRGEELALHVVRAHRLWERYLADEAQLPLVHLHREAHRAEHLLTPTDVEALEAHLGHPNRDPHGDPIPGLRGVEGGSLGTPLVDWELGVPAVIAHLEDEPPDAYAAVTSLGLKPGDRITVVKREPETLVLRDREGEALLSRHAAAGIHVRPAEGPPDLGPEVIRLSELAHGHGARVVRIDDACRGFTRRRLLDMGVTSGARIRAELKNALGDPRGFRVRGTLLALRREQAAQIWVKPDPAKRANVRGR